MFKKKNSEASISLIVAAVAGLIIIIAVLFMVGKKVGSFVEGKENVKSCENACSAVGMENAPIQRELCEEFEWQYVPGEYSDVTPPNVCCCSPPV